MLKCIPTCTSFFQATKALNELSPVSDSSFTLVLTLWTSLFLSVSPLFTRLVPSLLLTYISSLLRNEFKTFSWHNAQLAWKDILRMKNAPKGRQSYALARIHPFIEKEKNRASVEEDAWKMRLLRITFAWQGLVQQ